jgi:uncharacterized protein YndB with AHSA1/START domain
VKILVKTEINQPRALVFDQVADARNEAKWNSTLTDYRLVSSGPVGKGSVFTYKNRGNEFTSTLSEYNKPDSLTFQVRGKPMNINASVLFDAKATDVTLIKATYDLIPKGAMKLLLPIFGPFLRKAFAKEFNNFKKFSESQ